MKDPVELFKKLEADCCAPIPGKSVYAIVVRNSIFYAGAEHLIYVGSSLDANRRRMNPGHPYRICLERFPNHLVALKHFLTDDYLEDEKILIRHFKPVLNIIHKYPSHAKR